jgi:hypothetical protein
MQIARNGSGEEVLLSPTGNSIAVRPGSVKGQVEAFEETSETFILKGWAADVIEKRAASSVLIFSDGKLVYSGSPTIKNLNIADTLQSDSLLHSGFHLAIPKPQMHVSSDHLRLFGLSNGVAGELEFRR